MIFQRRGETGPSQNLLQRNISEQSNPSEHIFATTWERVSKFLQESKSACTKSRQN